MLLSGIDFLAESSKNNSNIKIINASIRSGNLSHAYLFYGRDMEMLTEIALNFAASVNCEENGCGKCRICANTLKGLYENLIIVEAEGNFITIDRVAEIQKFMGISAYSSGYKVCIIKEADLMNRTAANRMLKTLEDPPDERSIFILLTEDISGLLPTITSRCIIFEWDFSGPEELKLNIDPDSLNEMITGGLKKILDEPGNYKVSLDLSVKVLDFLEENAPDDSGSFKQQLADYRNTGATAAEIKKFESSLRARSRRKKDKYNNLGINMVFDIITAWLEDMLTVKLGADGKSMNFPDEYSYCKEHKDFLDERWIYNLLKDIERNRSYLKFSIYHEIALDSIFLQLQSRGSIKGKKSKVELR
jgi:DNA polymerase-3 subunit delta'